MTDTNTKKDDCLTIRVTAGNVAKCHLRDALGFDTPKQWVKQVKLWREIDVDFEREYGNFLAKNHVSIGLAKEIVRKLWGTGTVVEFETNTAKIAQVI